ncbi:hypothetical protein NCAS_0G00920 [Naumovozyma castellii]|uniref:serine--tRNA ligase n=1 Tax=Naumovozyma castellii TaxID=27288 RepID=G0VHU5_NAUCA|nr:hypothetical protein NCAS_0G00920 [Naumovozyma castellii CBS 4309]CCC70979.1 hypothetical protein NCAS_0G00920 [Naumovozyma castellii CBS 4309]
MWHRAFSTSLSRSVLKKPQFDVKSILANIEGYERSIRARQLHSTDTLLSQLSILPGKYDEMRHLNDEIAKVQIERKKIESLIKQDRSQMVSKKADLKQLKEQSQKLTNSLTLLKSSITETCSLLPNLTANDVPLTEPEIVHWINPRTSYDADPTLSHVEIMTKKNMLDLRRAATVSGTSWYYLLNEGAELEMALVRYAIDKVKGSGFQVAIPPSITRLDIIDSCGFRPRDMNDERQIYKLDGEERGLVATAEISLAGLGYDEELNLNEYEGGIKKMVGCNRSYRAEAGARGKDTKGLYRVHEFTKVEMFCWCKPADSAAVLEELRDLQIDIVSSLGLSAKVMNMPANDLGNPALKKYDIEAWMPGRGSFGEISSTSNCTDFQSRRLNTRYRNTDGKLEFVHTLNGTAMAVPRIILALVENFYDKTTHQIHLPQALWSYMGGKKHI